MPIPRLVHTWWEGKMDWMARGCRSQLQTVCAREGWQLCVSDDEIETVRNFDTLDVQHKADWVRLCLIAKFGGVWVDGTVIVNTLSQFAGDGEYVLGYGFPCDDACEPVLENWCFAAPAAHPLILAWKAEFKRAIEMGFETFKDTEAKKLGDHFITKHLPYLTCHACYALVHDDRLVRMASSQDGPYLYKARPGRQVGPFKIDPWSNLLVIRLALFSYDQPVVKITGWDRNVLQFVHFSLPASSMARVFPHTVLNTAILFVCVASLLLVCSRHRMKTSTTV